MSYLYSIDQIHNPDKILTSLLTDLTSTHKVPAMGGPTTSDVHLQQAPFCFSRKNSINNSYPQLGTILPHLCNHTSHFSFSSGQFHLPCLWNCGTFSYFLRETPSAYGINTPLVVATLEKAMAPYSSTLAWKIPWMEEPGRL